MSVPKRILICPLDWGLGHATRCIPIIRLLLKKGHAVIIAAGGRPMALLRQEFPELQFIVFNGYPITYPASGAMTFKMLLSAPKILAGIKEEHRTLDSIIDKHSIDVVISDNRYGCYSKKVKSIFITHQVMIKAPFGEKLLHKLVLNYIGRYNECWVPDVAGNDNLSGDLSHKYPLPANTFFIGGLSRFEKQNATSENKYDVMAVISGPEPQRSIFEKMVLEQLEKTDLKALVVCGKTENASGMITKKNIQIVNHLKADAFRDAALSSAVILSRSGYSTIMDLAALNKKAIFIPTPGQTEQEYLAKLFMKKGIAFFQEQEEFELLAAMKENEKYKGFSRVESEGLLEDRVAGL